MKKLMACGLAVLGAVAAFGEKWVDAQASAGGDGTKGAPFQTIQEAIDAASANETIWVRPGDYTTGETRDTMPDSLTLARVLITKPLRIESTGGAAATHIVGASDTSETDATAKQNGLGENSVRCVMAEAAAVGSILKGFTIRDGHSRYANNQDVFASHGGGIASHAENALTVVDCVISNNVAAYGGACYRVNLVRSLLTHNRATDGGGAATRFCSHYACVVAHNGDATESASKSAIADPRNVVHCSIFGNGNGGVYLEADSAPTICNSIVILDGNDSGTAYSVNIASTTSRSPTFAKCIVTAVANQATQVTVDTSELVCSREPWRTMVSPYSGDYRAVKGGPCDGTANPTVVSPSWVPEEFRGMDFYGRPFLAGGKANIGAVAASAKAAGGVHVLNGSTAWSVDGYEKNPGYGEKMYVRGMPTDSITLRETDTDKIFNFEQRYCGDWGWLRVFDNAGKLVIAMPPEGTVVTNWSNGAKGVVYADPKGSDANDGSAAVADGNGKGPVKTLKKAVELAAENYIVRCAEGVYDEGTVKAGSWATRLALTKNVVVRGAGAGKSIIKGNCDLADPSEHGCGADAVRCVYADNVGKTSAVIGFTLQDGYVSGGPSSASEPFKGGAFYAPVFNSRAQLVDCVVTNCAGSRGVMYGGWAHRTKFVGNHLSKNSSESFRDLIMSACVVVDNNPAKGGYYTVANGSLVVVNTTFAGNGNPYNASSIFGQINGSAQIVLNCVVDGDQQNACTGACADGNWQSYRSGQTGWNYVEAMNLADLQNRDLRPRADSPVVGGGSFGNDAVITGLDQCNNLTAAQWYSMVTSTDIDGNPYLYVDGKPTAGAYQRPVAVVTVEAAAAGEVAPTGTWIKQTGDTVTLTAKGAEERKFLGFWVNGELVPQGEKSYVFTVPDGIYSKPFVLKAAYNTDWYVNPDPAFGKDTNDGWTPQTAKRSLVAAMKGPVSGDTVHAAIGVYNDGTVADGDNSVTKCRVNVPSGVTLLGDDRDGTIIEGKASATVSSGLGTDSVRGVYLCANAKLKNLTVRKGYTHNGANATESRGAGVLGKSTDTCIVEDCTIRDCRGSRSGGGQYVTFNRCRLIDNYGASTGAAGRNCSYYNTYIVGCSGNARSMQETTWFVNSTYDVDENDAATVRNLFEGGNARIENSVFLQPNSILSSAVTSASNSVFVTGSGISLASAKCCNVRTNTLEEIALDAVTRVPTAASCLVDAGNTAMVERIGDLDCDCSQRVYNGAIDIGAFEHDWRGRYGAVIGATVTAASPEAVERDGAVYLPSGEIAVIWNGGEGLWGIPAEVTGTGVLELYVGDEEDPVHVWMAADEPLLRWPCQTASANLRFRYVPGENDTGGAFLKPLTKFVNYLMPEVNELGDVVFVERATNAIPVTAATAELGDGWYVVAGEVSRAGIDVLPGCTANLVLADGASLTVAGGTSCAGIDVRPGETLNIYGQQDGTGRLVATGGSGDGYAGGAGIGGGYQTDGGTVTICGGSVTAEGGLYAAGIGGGDGGGGGEVTIYGGAVTVVGKKGAQGLGGGSGRGGGTNLIYGGTVRAEGGEGAYGIGGSTIELSENMVMYDITDGEPGVEVTSGSYFRIRKSFTKVRPEPVVETFGRDWYVTAERGVYIGTRFKPGSNTRVEMDVLVGDAQEYWFGCWDGDWDDRAFALGNDATDEVYCGYGSGDTCGGIKGLIQPGRVTVALEKGVVYTNGVVWSAAHEDSSTAFSLNHNLYLFAQNRKGTAYPGWEQQRIVCYGCKIWTNGMNGATLVRNFVPARTKDEQQIVGLYDTATGRFFAPRDGTLTLGYDEDVGKYAMVTVGELDHMTAAYTFGDGSVTNMISGTSFEVLKGTENVKVVFTAEDGYMLDKTEVAIRSPLTGDYTLAAADLPTATSVFTLNVPADGATVALYTDDQKKYFELTGTAIKTKYTGFDPSMRDRYLHPSVTLSWTGANGAVTVRVTRQGGRVLVSKELASGTESLAVYNLEVGATYTWTVTDAEGASASAAFTTEAQAPRILNGDQIPSVRDLGGWVGLQGIRVKQGELVRTAHLDDESTGASLLTDTSRDTFLNVIGVKTELDFRSSTELAKIGRDSSSKLGATVTRYCYPVPSYALGDFVPGEDKPYGYFALAFQRVFDSGSRPLAFHGKIGRDRTGTFAALILSLLGVSEDDILREYRIAGDFSTSSYFHIDEVITALKTTYPAETLAASAKRYFTEAVGFTADEVEQFRAEMLPGYDPPDDPQPREMDPIGVCSWSWHEPMTNIIRRMEANGFKGIQLALSPWVWEGEGSAAQKETFGDQEGEEVFNLISNKFAKGELDIHATMICFSNEDYTTEYTISNTCGFYYGLAPSATEEQKELADLTWEIRSNQFAKAVERTRALGVRNITAHIGLSEYDDANMSRLYWACKTCRENGCKLLVETGMYSAERTVAALKRFTELHPDAEIGLNFDTANQVLYGADNPTNAYAVMKGWIEQVHIKDCVETYSARGSWATDVEWGRGDVSRTYDMISVLKADGFAGPMLVEHESGSADPDVREREILTAVKAIRGESAPVAAGLGEVLGPYLTAVAATNAARGAEFTPSAEVAAALGTDDARATYCNMFEFDVVLTAGGKWAVAAFLKPQDWTNVVESAQTATRQIPVAELAAQEYGTPLEDVPLTNCVPGFYYSLYDGSAVTNVSVDLNEDNRDILCGPGKTVTIPILSQPSSASGFFAIGVLEIPMVYVPGEDHVITGLHFEIPKPRRR